MGGILELWIDVSLDSMDSVNWVKESVMVTDAQCPFFPEAEAATEHHEGLRKGLSGAFRCDWEGIFLIRKVNLCSDQPDLLSLF